MNELLGCVQTIIYELATTFEATFGVSVHQNMCGFAVARK